MEGEAARADQQVSKECDEEDSVMPVLPAIVHALESKRDEQYVGQGVDDLRGIWRRIVILGPP